MSTTYTEHPENFCEVETFVETEIKEIKRIFFEAERILFYDVCSFQKHSALAEKEMNILIKYFKEHGIIIFVTRCILMEMASELHVLPEKYVVFFKRISDFGVKVVIFNEEYTYDILSECYSVNEKINEYLVWSNRIVKSPASVITETLKNDKRLYSEIVKGQQLKSSDLYKRFFVAVRDNKEHNDNLGEELITICIYILSCLPGISDGKLCVLTDDKGVAGKINCIIKNTNSNYRGAKIILFSTPKLVQHMYREHVDITEDEMISIISQGTNGNVAVMGITEFDLDVNLKISMTGRELVQKIMEPNGIEIVF